MLKVFEVNLTQACNLTCNLRRLSREKKEQLFGSLVKNRRFKLFNFLVFWILNLNFGV